MSFADLSARVAQLELELAVACRVLDEAGLADVFHDELAAAKAGDDDYGLPADED